MGDDEREYDDDDLRREAIDQRRETVRQHRHATAWDEPPGYYDDDAEGG